MCKMVVLAAVVAALAIVSEPAEQVTEASVLAICRGTLGRSCTCDTMASSSTTVASLECIVRPSRGTSGTSSTMVSRPSSDMSHGSSRDTSGTSASAVWCSSSATGMSRSGSAMCRSSIVSSAAGIIIACCSSGSTSHSGSGRGTIAALPLKKGVAFMGTAKACRIHTAAGVAGWTVARLQMLYSNSSRRWAFDTCQSFCAAGIPEDRGGSTARPHATAC
jgi:hypothetical protein